jgi:hypothetical protein
MANHFRDALRFHGVLGWDFQHLGEDDEVFIVVIFSKAFLSILALSVGAGKLMRTMQPSLPTVKPLQKKEHR